MVVWQLKDIEREARSGQFLTGNIKRLYIYIYMCVMNACAVNAPREIKK